MDGFAEMVRRLEPQVVLSYGRLPAACQGLVEAVTYPTRWNNIGGEVGTVEEMIYLRASHDTYPQVNSSQTERYAPMASK